MRISSSSSVARRLELKHATALTKPLRRRAHLHNWQVVVNGDLADTAIQIHLDNVLSRRAHHLAPQQYVSIGTFVPGKRVN